MRPGARPTAGQIRNFANRPWSAIRESKARRRASLDATHGVQAADCVGEALWLHKRDVDPAWPTATERARDLRDHRRTLEKLRQLGDLADVIALR